MIQKMIQLILLIPLVYQSCNGIYLIKKNNLNGLISSNLTKISISSQIMDKNSSTINDSFLIEMPSIQITKNRFYTVKNSIKNKSLNGTMNGHLTSFKFKRNNTIERAFELNKTDHNCLNDVFTRMNETIKNNSEINDLNCDVYFRCSDSIHQLNSSNNQLFNQSNQLIEKRFYCDGICDCHNCRDEINCSLSKCDKPNQIMCQDKSKCIEPSKICDSIFHCRDHSDEIGCFDSRGCFQSGRFFCDNNKLTNNLCIEKALVCDGLKSDCLDGSDELHCNKCKENEFRCFNGECINQTLRCNGIEYDGCSDGSDEWSCVLIDERDVILLPGLNHGVLCANSNFSIQEADEICNKIGRESVEEFGQIEIELENGTQWVNNLNFRTQRAQFNLSDPAKLMNQSNKLNKTYNQLNNSTQEFICKDNLAQTVTCKKHTCSSIHRTNSSNRQIGTPREIESMIRLTVNYLDLNTNNTKLIECYGQIISPIWLLSSFSCLNSFLINNIKLNEIVISLNHNQNLTSKIKKIILHPHSVKRSIFIRNFDLGLVELENAIIFEEKGADAICLPSREIDVDITCFLTNFNYSESIAFQIIDREVCNNFKHYNGSLLKDSICAIKQKDHEDDSRQIVTNSNNLQSNLENTDYNSTNLFRTTRTINNQNYNYPLGSPLICLNSDSKWFLAGFLNHFDNRNNLEHPTVFSNIWIMLDFINRVTGLDQ